MSSSAAALLSKSVRARVISCVQSQGSVDRARENNRGGGHEGTAGCVVSPRFARNSLRRSERPHGRLTLVQSLRQTDRTERTRPRIQFPHRPPKVFRFRLDSPRRRRLRWRSHETVGSYARRQAERRRTPAFREGAIRLLWDRTKYRRLAER